MSRLWGLALPLALLGAQDPSSDAEFFEKKVRPVLVDRCDSCHGAQSSKPKGNLRLDRREHLLKGGDRGPAIVPGNPDKSLLISALLQADDDLKMPPKGKLTPAQIEDFRTWVKRGAAMPAPAAAASSAESGERHWAFLPPTEGSPPAVKRKDWVRSPIDAFILARLEARGISPAPPSDRRTLLRRVSVDLIGLPPTPEETEAFLANPAPNAFEREVDRLLASPRYGERWGRHWLDVARHADTTDGTVNGSADGDVRMVHSAAYRDWVIRAFNDDLPYDRFLMEQIAADQLVPDDRRRDLAAMGFLTIGRRFAGNVQDTIDDRLDALCRGTMGLTMGCARCHDHKFDPIPTRDYYSLYGVFQASKERTVALPGSPDAAFDVELRKRNGELQAYRRAMGEEVKRRVRAGIADYFAALVESDEAASAKGLHPQIVRAWKAYIANAKKEFHPVLGAWHALSAASEAEFDATLRSIAPRLNGRVARAMMEPPVKTLQDAASRYGALLTDPSDDELRSLVSGPKALPPLDRAPEALEEFFDIPAGYQVSYLKSKIARWENAAPAAPARAVILEDAPPKEGPRVFKRGNPGNPGEAVPRQFLEVLCGSRREPFRNGSGRLELARAIASAENPLTARVMVNRVWHHHFGAGLVRTPSDFGLRSEPPSHPELLDWLACRFVSDRWSIKELHRRIVTSNVYRQSCADDPSARRVDPENRLLWRMNPRRLEFEALRDSLLAAAGALDLAVGGPAEVLTAQPFSRRRSVYGFVDRLNVSNLLLSFDVANPVSHSPQRHTTTVPQQALFMMNSPFLLEQARRLAARPEVKAETTTAGRVQAMYRLLFARSATEVETAAARRFLEGSAPGAPPAPSAWTYGTGEAAGGVVRFEPLPWFTGQSWQCAPYLPHPDLGWIQLDATGGQPGDNLQHAVIRRWTAPRAGALSVRGAMRLLYDADVYNGSVRARIVSSRAGELLARDVSRGEVALEVEATVKEGDTLDFVAECPERAAYSRFSWAPLIRMETAAWSAEADFAGPAETPLAPWEAYAQVLLMSNEFAFVD
jgi:hypothetical protein